MRPDELVEKAQMRGRLQMTPFMTYFFILSVVADYPTAGHWVKPTAVVLVAFSLIALEWYFRRHPLVRPLPKLSST